MSRWNPTRNLPAAFAWSLLGFLSAVSRLVRTTTRRPSPRQLSPFPTRLSLSPPPHHTRSRSDRFPLRHLVCIFGFTPSLCFFWNGSQRGREAGRGRAIGGGWGGTGAWGGATRRCRTTTNCWRRSGMGPARLSTGRFTSPPTRLSRSSAWISIAATITSWVSPSVCLRSTFVSHWGPVLGIGSREQIGSRLSGRWL